MIRVGIVKDAVIGSPPHALRPSISRVIDQSDRNTSLSHVIQMFIAWLMSNKVESYVCELCQDKENTCLQSLQSSYSEIYKKWSGYFPLNVV